MRLRTIAASAAACVAAMGLSTAASATPFILNYGGTAIGTGTPFSVLLNLDLASNGAVASFVSGTRDGAAITGLSNYAYADNRLSSGTPYVSFAGLSYTVAGGTKYNFFFDSTGSVFTPAGAAGYGEVNSIADPDGNGIRASRATFVSINGVTIAGVAPTVTSAVPEPASWAMMIGGIGAAGGSLRRRRKSGVTTRVA